MNNFNHTIRKPLILNMYSINALRYLEVSIFTCKGKKVCRNGQAFIAFINFKFDKTFIDYIFNTKGFLTVWLKPFI